MLETMHFAAAALAPRGNALRTGPSDRSMRVARSCYDHLAGRVGVALADSVTARDYVQWTLGEGGLTETGVSFLTDWGIDVAQVRHSRRMFCRPCLDWSERRLHLGGALGSAILDRILDLGWMRRGTGTRALSITPKGRAGLSEVFAIEPDTELEEATLI